MIPMLTLIAAMLIVSTAVLLPALVLAGGVHGLNNLTNEIQLRRGFVWHNQRGWVRPQN